MRLRAQRRRGEVPIEQAADAIAQSPVSSDAFLIERAILALPEQQREVFVLRQLEGYEYNEISELLEISPGAARVRYLRALRRLRQLLESA
jgi:RNA polymerase sigma-70 factor (ECF subfamily)